VSGGNGLSFTAPASFNEPDVTLPEITVTPNGSLPTYGSPYGSDAATAATGTAANSGDVNSFGIPSAIAGAANSFDSGLGDLPSTGNGAGDSTGSAATSGSGATAGFANILSDIGNFLERGGLILLAIVVIAVGGWALTRRG
jgi:hypothetical protein